MTIEDHPIKPFLPDNAEILFLGSFPPPKFRWSIEFFYPNWINDFWRIMGLIFFNDKSYFELKDAKRFDKELIVEFANSNGFAFYDTAQKVKRLNDDASDKFLEILQPSDILSFIRQLTKCSKVVTTGGKASEELYSQFRTFIIDNDNALPKVGEFKTIIIDYRQIQWWRMPSSSRAYPLSLDKKADFYKRLF